VFAMLKKADTALSRKDFDALPFDAKTALLQCLSKVFTRFLPSPPPSGSQQTVKPKL
jgi:hypothetical protein